MKPHVVAVIFARGGSKGVPRKNVRPLAGKPLLARAVEAARRSRYVTRVVVSTEDEEIAAIAREYGAEVPFTRPAELAQDHSPEWLAWQHAVQTLQEAGGPPMDVLLSVPTTSPLRAPEDLDACVELLLGSDADVVLTVRPSERSPYFNMVELDAEGRAALVIPPAATVHRRQAAPPVFDITTVAYAARPDAVLRQASLLQGKTRAVVVPPERALDIDTELDWEIAEFMLRRRADTPAR